MRNKSIYHPANGLCKVFPLLKRNEWLPVQRKKVFIILVEFIVAYYEPFSSVCWKIAAAVVPDPTILMFSMNAIALTFAVQFVVSAIHKLLFSDIFLHLHSSFSRGPYIFFYSFHKSLWQHFFLLNICAMRNNQQISAKTREVSGIKSPPKEKILNILFKMIIALYRNWIFFWNYHYVIKLFLV